MADLLDEDGIVDALVKVPQWHREDGEIVCERRFKSYLEGVTFVVRVAELAEEINHHPDIHLGWRKVTLRLSTHSKGGLTALDFSLAGKIDRVEG